MTIEEQQDENLAKWYDSIPEHLRVTTFPDLKKLYSKWLYMTPEQADGVDVVVAMALERSIPGTPLWLYLIGPPGAYKTELARALKPWSFIFTLDTLTPASLISGKLVENKETGESYPIGGVLLLLNGKVLVIKDFTTILSLPEQQRSEIYGQLRSCHDGYFEKAFGTMRQPLRIAANFGLLACVTPAIDRYTKAHSALGERFLKFRAHSDDDARAKAAQKAFKNAERGNLMRYELSRATAWFLRYTQLQFQNNDSKLPTISVEQTNRILGMANYISTMRCRVYCKYAKGQITRLDISEPEIPTRASKQLKKMITLLAIIRGHDKIEDSDMKTLERITKDTSIPSRQSVVDAMIEMGGPDSIITLSERSGLHYNTTKNELEKMASLGIVECAVDDVLYGFSKTFFERCVKSVYGESVGYSEVYFK